MELDVATATVSFTPFNKGTEQLIYLLINKLTVTGSRGPTDFGVSGCY